MRCSYVEGKIQTEHVSVAPSTKGNPATARVGDVADRWGEKDARVINREGEKVGKKEKKRLATDRWAYMSGEIGRALQSSSLIT